MKNEEAKFILSAYRLGGQDASDPRFQEALEQVQRDPELAKWFAEQRAFDQALRRKLLTATPIPPELRTTLLAAKNIVLPASWWSRYAWLTAAAACFVVMVVSILLWKGVDRNFALSRHLADASATQAGHVTVESKDLAEIQRWLVANQGVETFEIPTGLKAWAPMGCRIVDWQGMKISMICFHGGAERHVDLFVGDVTPRIELKTTPEIANVDGHALISWRTGNRFYALTGRDRDSLVKLL